MAEISSVQSIAKKLAIRLLRKAEPVISRVGELADDVFEREPRLRRASDYVQDVVFEKTGRVFPKIRATAQGKPIATTRKDLFRQLRDLPFDETKFQKKPTLDFLHRNILNLGNYDVKTISEISKLLKDLEKDPALEIILKRLPWDENVLSTMNKLLSRNFSLDEMKTILSTAEWHRFNNIGIVLNINPKLSSSEIAKSVTKDYSIKLPDIMRRTDRVKAKLNDVDDEKISEFVNSSGIFQADSEFNKNLSASKNYFISKGGLDELEKTEMLLDAYHSQNNFYSNVNGEAHEFYKVLEQKADAGEGLPKEVKELAEIAEFSPEDKMLEYDSLDFASPAKCFNEAVRLEPLKEFIGRYSKEEPQMAKYLYEKYFLTKIPQRLRESYRKMVEEFGTYVFTENSQTVLVDKRIYPEFDAWQKSSNGNAKYPAVFDLSHAKKEFIRPVKKANGFFYPQLSSINIPNDELYYDFLRTSRGTLRHEMTHLNDTVFKDINDIIQNRMYASELKAVGLSDEAINYAYTNKSELVAVASTGDCSKYSEEFKNVLVELGMPKWVFNFKPLEELGKEESNDMGILVEKLKGRFSIPARYNTSGNIPNGIMIQGLKPKSLDEVAELLALHSDFNYRKIDFAELTPEDALRKLGDIAKSAKDDNKRTILQIDNFSRFTAITEGDSSFIPKLKAFLTSCAEKYKCTVVADTEDISKITPEVMAVQRFPIKLDASGNQINNY